MKNKLLVILVALCTLYGITACSDEGGISKVPTRKTEDSVSSTVLVYMVGQNNLNSIMLSENIPSMMRGMRTAPSGGKWLVYVDTSTSPKLYELVKNAQGTVVQNLIRTYENQNSTNPDVMAEVINDAFERYPAKDYGLVFSSHADGWFASMNKAPLLRAFGTEETSTSTYSMDITDMADALSRTPHSRFILFDACQMGGIEVAYQFRDVTDYLLASPAPVPGLGYPYYSSVPYLLAMKVTSFSTTLNQFYTRYCQNDFGTMSLVKTSELENLAAKFREMMQVPSVLKRANTLSRAGMQSYEMGVPIYDLGQLVDSLGVSSDTCVTKIRSVLRKTIVYEIHTKYSTIDDSGNLCNEIKFHSGLSSYIPYLNNATSSTVYDLRFFTNYYKTLDWYKASGWDLVTRF